jgi:DNA polymerase IV
MSVRAGGHRYERGPYGRPRADYIIAPKAGRILATGLEVKRIEAVFTHQKVRRLGIETSADLRAKPFALLQQHFGGHLVSRHCERERRSAGGCRPAEKIRSETTFARDLTAPDEIEAASWPWPMMYVPGARRPASSAEP